jgi:signal peptidase I
MIKERIKVPTIIIMSILSTIFLFKWILFIGYVPTESMSPTIKKDSLIIGTRYMEQIERDDVVIFVKDCIHEIKRVKGVSNDSIDIIDGFVYINVICEGASDQPDEHFVVAQDFYYLIGDNRNNSNDSRYWDEPCVENNQIHAKLILNHCLD